MAFFDDLKNNFNKAKDATVQKTKEIAETTKLNSLISDEENKIRNTYLEIGKLYMKMEDKNDPIFKEKEDTIKEAEEKIKEYKQKILDVKGATRCECGAEVAKDATFCMACGKKVVANEEKTEEIKEEKKEKKCPKCGAIVADDAEVCLLCGEKM